MGDGEWEDREWGNGESGDGEWGDGEWGDGEWGTEGMVGRGQKWETGGKGKVCPIL